MKVVILHQTITNHDAIGNDIKQMYNILRQKHECYVYCENLFNQNLNLISKKELFKTIDVEENLIIYHHSVHWEEGEEILEKCKAKMIIRYHNITPESFFEEYNKFYFQKCYLGREQTRRIGENYKDALWMVDSKYNALDIDFYEQEKVVVVPPFNNIEEWNTVKPHEEILKSLIESKKINLLFVGRIAPNKGHRFLIEIIRNYVENYGTDIQLNIIGKKDMGLEGYNRELKDLIEYYHLFNQIKFIGEINDSILVSYYLGSDFFICASEHEGFCVPLLEAQYLRLPVIARDSSAVKETLGQNQLILNENINEYAAAIKTLYDNTGYREFVIQKALENYNKRFENTNITRLFKETIEKFMDVIV